MIGALLMAAVLCDPGTPEVWIKINKPDGSCAQTTVPLRDGCLPDITEYTTVDGRTVYQLNYCRQVPYSVAATNYVLLPNAPTCVPASPPKAMRAVQPEPVTAPSIPAPTTPIAPITPAKQPERFDRPAQETHSNLKTLQEMMQNGTNRRLGPSY